jgi:hypothetical protein
MLIGFVTVAVAIVALFAARSLGGGSGTAHSERTQARELGAARVAAAYGYPLRCLSVAVALHDPRFLRPDFDRTLWCVRYGAHPTAILRRDPRFK